MRSCEPSSSLAFAELLWSGSCRSLSQRLLRLLFREVTLKMLLVLRRPAMLWQEGPDNPRASVPDLVAPAPRYCSCARGTEARQSLQN